METENQNKTGENVAPAVPATPKISIDDFKKVEIRIGQIKSAEKVANADKLLRLEVDFGPGQDAGQRQIVSGIAEFYPDAAAIIGKKCPFITNLEPRMIKGLESNGMIMAAVDREANKLSLLSVNDDIPVGTKIS